jgi:hypothetical protein
MKPLDPSTIAPVATPTISPIVTEAIRVQENHPKSLKSPRSKKCSFVIVAKRVIALSVTELTRKRKKVAVAVGVIAPKDPAGGAILVTLVAWLKIYNGYLADAGSRLASPTVRVGF